MEVKSEPKYETVTFTDVDVAFPGDLQQFVLRDGVDSFRQEGTVVYLSVNGGTVTIHLQHAHWFAIRTRTMRVPVQDPKPE